MTEEEVFAIRADMVGYASVRDAALVSKIEIRQEANADTIGPYSEPIPGGGHAIVIPDGFRRLQCQLVLIQFILYRLPNDDILDSIKQLHEDCMRERQDMVQCLPSVMKSVARIAEPIFDERVSADDKVAAKSIVDAAFRSIMFHEVGHIVLGHDPGASGSVATRQELDADQYAAIRSLLSSGPPVAGFSTFAVLSMLDDRIDWEREPHQSFVCRAQNAERVIKRFTTPMRALMILQGGSAEDYRRIRRESDGLSNFEMLKPRQRAALAAHSCAAGSTARMDAVEADLQRLIAAVDALGDAIPSAEDGEGMRVFIRQLRAVRLTTAEGRSVRESIVSTRLFRVIGGDADRTQHEAIAAETLKGADPQDWLSQDYGRYFKFEATSILANAPAGSDAATVIAKTRELAVQAVFYNPHLSSAWFLLSQMEYMSGNCDAGVLAGKRSLATAEKPDQQREFIDLVEGAYRKIGCPAVQKVLVDGQKQRAGWH